MDLQHAAEALSRKQSHCTPGEGVFGLNLYGDVPTKKIFHPAPESLPSNDTLF